MKNESDKPSTAADGAGTELMDATIRVEHLGAAETEAKVLSALQGLPGVKAVGVIAGKAVQVTYDPTETTEAKLEEVICRTGNQPSKGTTERDSPFA